MPEKIKDAKLTRRLGVVGATMAGTGVILGAGIYVLVGVAAGEAGNAVWLSFIFAAVAAGLTGLSYIRMGKLRPKNAPEFQYVDMAFGRRPAFIAGWLVLWATVISAAAVALGFAGYLSHLLGWPILPAAIGLIVFSALVVFIGIGESVLVAGILTVIETIGIIIIIGIGLPHIGAVDYLEMPSGFTGVIGASSLVFFAYLGFEGMANLSEEMKNPQRDLPVAIILALGISTLLYVLVSFAVVSVLGWHELSQSRAPLAAVAARVLGSRADLMMTFIALSSTANTVLMLLLAASRAMYAMSCAGVLPTRMCVVGKYRHTPWMTIIVVGVLASLFAAIRSIEQVASFTNFATLAAFIMVNIAAIKVSGKKEMKGGFKRLLTGIILPGAGAAVYLWLAVSAGWLAALLGAGLVLVGLLAYWAIDKFHGKARSD